MRRYLIGDTFRAKAAGPGFWKLFEKGRTDQGAPIYWLKSHYWPASRHWRSRPRNWVTALSEEEIGAHLRLIS